MVEEGFNLNTYTPFLPWKPRKNSLGTKEECFGLQKTLILNYGNMLWKLKKKSSQTHMFQKAPQIKIIIGPVLHHV